MRFFYARNPGGIRFPCRECGEYKTPQGGISPPSKVGFKLLTPVILTGGNPLKGTLIMNTLFLLTQQPPVGKAHSRHCSKFLHVLHQRLRIERLALGGAL